jgi:hypothetical protein
MPRFFNLAGVTPEVFILFLLMLKYDHFFGQIGGRVSTKLMILGSPIVHHLLAMLEDTRVFPYFETKHHNMMLMCNGHVFHFVTAICGQPNNANRSMRAMVINHILNHILSRIACDPAIALGLEVSIRNMMEYPLRRESQLRVSIYTARLFSDFRVSTIWELLSLFAVLPDPQAIQDMTSDGLDEYMRMHYGIIKLIALFRNLFVQKNPVFLLFCKFFHKKRKLFEQNRSDRYLRIKFKQKFERARRSSPNQYQVLVQYFAHISRFFPKTKIKNPMHQEIDWCLEMIGMVYSQMMDIPDYYWRVVTMVFRSESIDVVHSLLKSSESSSHNLSHLPLEFTLDYPEQSEGIRQEILQPLFKALRRAHSLVIPRNLFDFLEEQINAYLDNDPLRVRNKWSRLLFLFFTFIKLVQKNHPHLCFLLESFVFIRTNQARHLDQLAILLDLGRGLPISIFQDLGRFNELLQHFCSFTNPTAGFSETNEKSFLGLIDLMMCMLSNNHFIADFSEFLTNIPVGSRWLNIPINGFIHRLQFSYRTFVDQIQPFRHTNCLECNCLLDYDCDRLCSHCELIADAQENDEYDDDCKLYQQAQSEKYPNRHMWFGQ